MKIVKIAFISVALLIFVCWSVTGLLAAFGIISLPSQNALAAILGPCLGIIAAVIGAKHLFDDPETVFELKNLHLDEKLRLQEEHRKEIAETHHRHANQIEVLNLQMRDLQFQLHAKEFEVKELNLDSVELRYGKVARERLEQLQKSGRPLKDS